MNTDEKALDLVCKFLPHTALTQIFNKQMPDPEHWGKAKACAIILVDQILELGFNNMHKPEYAAFLVADKFTRKEPIEPGYLSAYEMQEYWEEVWQKIDCL